MTEKLVEMLMINEIGTRATVLEVVVTILVSLALALLISWVYIRTHHGADYMQSFVHTLVIVTVVIAIIIVAIGSDIAKAFSLAGALSIIRFRSAIQDPRDVAFIFFAMGTGLACGAGLFLPAVIFALMMCVIIYVLFLTDYGRKHHKAKTLKITVPENLNYEGLFDDILNQHLDSYKLLGIRTTNLGTMFEIAYNVHSRQDTNEKEMIDEIRARNGNLSVSLFLDTQTFY